MTAATRFAILLRHVPVAIYLCLVAWLWWLLVPVVLTVVGSMLVAGQGILRSRRHVRARKDPIADHANFLRALPETSEQYPLPVTIVVSDETEPAVIETEATQSA